MTTIPMTTLHYFDAKGIYREARFHAKEDLEAFTARLARAGGQIIQY